MGICCATLDEAEAMADAGIGGLLVTSPVTASDKLGRLAALARKAPGIMVVADHPEAVAALGHAAREGGGPLGVLIDLDLGFARTGVTSPEAAVAVGRAIAREPALGYAGLQAYGGHIQHIGEFSLRLERNREAAGAIRAVADALAEAGLAPGLISGGGTGTHDLDGRSGLFDEVQAGSYVFMDAEYGAIDYDADRTGWPFRAALFVQMSVVSANAPGQVTVDAGTKSIAVNGPPPVVSTAALDGASYRFAGDEHGRIVLATGQAVPRLGERIECISSHCDPTVALHDLYFCVRGDVLVDI